MNVISRTASERHEPIPRPTDHRAGFTLLELTIAMSLAAVLAVSIGWVVDSCSGLFAEEVQRVDLDDGIERASNWLRGDLRRALPASVLPLLLADSSDIQFQPVTGYTGGTPDVGPPIRYYFLPANDGTGLGSLARQEGVETSLVLGRVRSVSFNAIQSGVRFVLRVEATTRDGTTIARVLDESVTFRNP